MSKAAKGIKTGTEEIGASEWRIPMLPPLEQRDAVREKWLKTLHWKDIDASEPGEVGSLITNRVQSRTFSPWIPITPGADDRLTDLLDKPSVTEGTSVLLSKPGAIDQSLITNGNNVKATAAEGEQRPPNQTLESAQSGSGPAATDEKNPLKISSKVEFKSELDQPQVEFGKKSARTLKEAAGEALGKSANKFESKYPKAEDIGPSVEYTAWDKKDEFRKIEGSKGPASGNLRVFYGETKGSAGGTVSRASGKGEAGISGEAGFLKAEGTLGSEDGLAKGKAQGRAVAVDGKAKLKGEYKFKEAEATVSGSLGASAVLLDGEIGGEVRITPRRLWNGLVVSGVNTAASWFGYEKQLEETDKYDWGIVLGVTAGGTVGLAAEVEASGGLSKKDRKAGIKTGVKLAPGLGGSIKGKAELVW